MKRKSGFIDTKSTKDRTNWKKLKAMSDSAIRFTKDAPRTKPEDWANAIAHKGIPDLMRQLGKTQIALRVDKDVLEWFKSQGPGYQTRMNAVLREFRDAHRGRR